MQARTASHQDLKNLELTDHIAMLVEDWNEPDDVAIGTSSMFIWRDTIYVHTPVTMKFRGDAEHRDSITTSMVTATYRDNKWVDIAVWDEEGALCYATDSGKNR
jgi:hypothetical protein